MVSPTIVYRFVRTSMAMAERKVLPARIVIGGDPLKHIKSMADEKNEVGLDNTVSSLRASIPAFPLGTTIICCYCFQEPSGDNPHTVKTKEIAFDSVMSSRWAHEYVYNFLKECADQSLDLNGKIRMVLSIEPGPGPGCITVVQAKSN